MYVVTAAIVQDILAPRTLAATRVDAGAIRIDGSLESAWDDLPVADHFVQSDPEPGSEAHYSTEARVAFDDEAIYFAVRAADPEPDGIVAPFLRRDDESRSDWVFVELDTRRDRRSAYSFGLNPRGVQVDGTWVNDADYDYSWNATWEGAARIDAGGWTAEFRVPFSQLAFIPDETVWGFNVYRYHARSGETSNWSPRLPDAA